MTGSEPTPGSQLKSSITDASRKIEAIIDDAERAADEIRAEARADSERESQRRIAEGAAKLSAVVDPLVKRIENLRVEAAALMHEIEAATLSLVELTKEAQTSAAPGEAPVEEASDEAAPEPAESQAPPAPADAQTPEEVDDSEVTEADSGPAPVAYPGTDETASPSDPPEEAVLRATQMAVAGNSRSEIEAALKDEFDLSDPAPVVDEILGPA